MTLALKGISKRLGTFELPALDLSVADGDYFVLLGPSGVGKTVLLEVIAGLMRPDGGSIHWRKRDVTYLPPESRGFAIVYQDYALFPHMTVLGNITFGLRTRGVSRSEAKAWAQKIARLVGVDDILGRWPVTLSGGEQQRVALARALTVEPELLLLDEPLSAVDLRMRRDLRVLLKRLHHELGATFLHVTHDVDEALQLGDRIGVMLDGRLEQVGTPEELFQRPTNAAVADFLGMRNILRATAANDGLCSVDGASLHVGVRPEPYRYIWIRPEEILLSATPFDSSARNQLSCTVASWEYHDMLVLVQLACRELKLSVLVTYASFDELALMEGSAVYATFKSSAVHCF
jgi:molybdate/tungstate transport system ATP-binding protein